MNRRTILPFVAAACLGLALPGAAQPPAGHGPGPAFGMAGAGLHGAGAEPARAAGGQSAAEAAPDALLRGRGALEARLQALLPADTTPRQACDGFARLGSCVAALHVAHNLGIPFGDLKAKLVGPGATGLGPAIHELRPQSDARSAQRQAEAEAKDDLDLAEH